MSRPTLEKFAIPGVLLLICFLAFTSQLLFLSIGPGPLTSKEVVAFNSGIACLLICYARSICTDPGVVPPGWKAPEDALHASSADSGNMTVNAPRKKWCRKCEAPKPPRAHHCRVCGRCIPKMDHHCPWTGNCVSHRTTPHFIRFLFYCVVTMVYLEKLLFGRLALLWENRGWPYYLGPSALQLAHLFILGVTNSFTLFALAILLIRVSWCIGANTTTIEGWEIDRHHVLLKRARVLGGQLPTANGDYMRIVKQEFPYDVGIWTNICQAMGTRNPLAWFWPFATSLPISSGLEFEVNGFEDAVTIWPPPDPDRQAFNKIVDNSSEALASGPYTDDDINEFRRRQQQDLDRRKNLNSSIVRRRPFHERYSHQRSSTQENSEGEEGWPNSEGERLADFGVDQDIDFYDEEDNIPLAELMARKTGA